MGYTATDRSDYQPLPEGTHRAVCSALIDLGLQNAFDAVKAQLLLRFEFPDNRVSRVVNGAQVDEPMVKWQFYTNSLNKKANLRRDLEGWRDRGFTKEELAGFDVRIIVGHACQISIIHDHSGDQVKDKIRTIGKIMGNAERPLPELEVIKYSKEEGEIGQWDILPDWVKEKITQAVEDNVVALPANADSEPFVDSDVPF
jgi:hypothetical protein